MLLISRLKVELVKTSETTKDSKVLEKIISTNNNDNLSKSATKLSPTALFDNPYRGEVSSEYKEKPSSLSYAVLYQMSVKNSIIAAVINTRINQVSTFSKPSRFSVDSVGYQLRLRDPKQAPTDEQVEIMTAIELFLENTGFSKDSGRDDFDTFLRKLVRDSLTYDQACFEIIPDRKGRPSEFYAVDASTIRASSSKDTSKNREEKSWVQVIDNVVVSQFSSKEMAFGVRNPRTHINLQPYGFSELEQLIQQVTSHLYAEEYNARYFSQGGTTKGIINLKADPNGMGNKEQLDSFKRQWRAQVSGMTGAWKTPVLQIPEGIEYINVSQSNRDMEFTQWMNYLVNIVCAVYQIDPAEVNFANNGGATNQGGVFESSQEAKLKNSKDKGLKPLLRFIESMINKNIISRFSQEYIFVFNGIDEKSENERSELDQKHVKTWKTLNELRQENGKEPLKYGDIILDPTYTNFYNQQAMQAPPDEGGGFDEESDEELDYSEYMSSYDEDEDLDEDSDEEDEEDGEFADDTVEDDEYEEALDKALNKLLSDFQVK